MSSEDQILENTIGQSGQVKTPPVNGIARAKRKDAGIRRRSKLDAMYDTFVDLTPEAQRGVLEILGVIHRQAGRRIEVKE